MAGYGGGREGGSDPAEVPKTPSLCPKALSGWTPRGRVLPPLQKTLQKGVQTPPLPLRKLRFTAYPGHGVGGGAGGGEDIIWPAGVGCVGRGGDDCRDLWQEMRGRISET